MNPLSNIYIILGALLILLLLGTIIAVIMVNIKKQNKINSLQQLIDMTPNPIFFKDINCIFTGCNKSFETLIWKERNDIIGKSVYDFFDKDVADLINQKELDLIKLGGESEFQFNFLHVDETEHTVLCHLTLQGGVKDTGLIGTFIDITERNKMEEEVRNLNEEYSLLLDNVPIQIWYLKDIDKYGKMNHAHARFLGVDKELAENSNIYENMIEEDAHELSKSIKGVFEEKRQVHTEIFLHNSLGEKKLLYILQTPRIDENSNVKHIVCAAVDITERGKYEDELFKMTIDTEKANKAKSMFLANMSHEIRTPMNAILGFLDLLMATQVTDLQKDYLTTISDSGQVLLTVINDILDFTKVEADQIEIEEIPFNLEYLIESALRIIRPRIQNRGVFLYYEYDKNLPKTFLGDPTRIRQIVLNLLSNADKFTKEGEIQVSIVNYNRASKGNTFDIYISVTDTGIGVPVKSQKNIFQVFSQADASTTRMYGGTGLGLALCRSLVEKMSGRIWVDSVPGKGSNFQFVIQLKKSDSTDHIITPTDLESFEGKKTIIIENNEYFRVMLEKNCREFGLVVSHSGANGREVLDFIANEQDPEYIIISDVLMTDMDGYEFARTVKHYMKCKNIKLIAISTSTLPGDAKKAQEKGYDAYLPKPVLKYDLVKVLQYTVSKKKDDPILITKHAINEADFERVKVLVAEDNPVNQKLIAAILTKNDFAVSIVGNGLEAVEVLKKEKFDICFMDIQMPEMDGFEATKKIRKKIDKDIPIIALTAAVMDEDRNRALKSGMNDFITKPVKPASLKKVISKWVEKDN